MAKPGPRPGVIVMTDAHRDKIRKSKILQRLINHAEGTEDMTQTQVTAALGLLKKALPDLSSVEMTGKDGGPIEHADVTQDASDFTSRISRLATRTGARAGVGETKH